MADRGIRLLLRARLLLGAVVLAILLLAPAVAHAATFSSALPVPLSTVTSSPPVVSVLATSTQAILGTPAMTIDGHAYPATLSWAILVPGYWDYDPDWDEDYWVPPVYDYTRAVVSCSPGTLTDGSRVASVTLPGTGGSYSWSFRVAEVPVLSTTTPAPGSTVTTTTSPVITVKATDNTAVSTWTATIDGTPVPATYDTATSLLRLAPPAPLSDFASHTTSVTVADADGNMSSKSWTFSLSVPITTFSSEAPAPGSVLVTVPTQASVTVTCTSNLISYSRVVKVDGTTVTSAFINPTGDPKRAQIIGYPSIAPGDGTHTVTVSVANIGGTTATDTWSFSVGVPPTLGTPLPLSGSRVSTDFPEITVPASDNSGVTTWTVTLNGAAAPATYDAVAKKLRVVLIAPLPNDDDTTVTVSVGDATGLRREVTWHFFVETLPEMAGGTDDCASCHPGFETDPDMSPRCLDCHPVTPGHTGVPSSLHTRADVSTCKPCHVSSITDEHARWNDHAGNPIDCLTCHKSADPNVRSAIAAKSSACTSCHTDLSGGHITVHDTAIAPVPLPGTTATCGDCHDANLMLEHAKPTASAKTAACAACHPTLRATITTFDPASCAQGGCHAADSATAVHGGMAAAHTQAAPGPSCVAAGCHANDLAAIHSAATTTTAGITLTGCLVCHVGGTIPASKDCTSCHGSEEPHLALHPTTFDSLNCGACHEANLLQEHVIDRGIACASCHSDPAHPEYAQVIAWSQSLCSDCHISAHGQTMTPSVPISVPLAPAYAFSTPIPVETFSRESWMPAELLGIGARMVVSDRAGQSVDDVWAYYRDTLAAAGWTVQSGAPVSGDQSIQVSFAQGRRHIILWCYAGEDHNPSPPSAAGCRIELSWYEEVQ